MYQKLYNTYLYYSFLRISFVLNLSSCRLIKEEYNYHDYVKTFAVENVANYHSYLFLDLCITVHVGDTETMIFLNSNISL